MAILQQLFQREFRGKTPPGHRKLLQRLIR